MIQKYRELREKVEKIMALRYKYDIISENPEAGDIYIGEAYNGNGVEMLEVRIYDMPHYHLYPEDGEFYDEFELSLLDTSLEDYEKELIEIQRKAEEEQKRKEEEEKIQRKENEEQQKWIRYEQLKAELEKLEKEL